MILNMVGGGGGGLNYSVKAYAPETALPSVEKENTIAVFTDVEPTSHTFNATEPESPEEGMVWFLVGASSTVAFVATKKNPVMVYPLSAKQFVDGEWVDKTAKTYQNGAWVSWITYIFDYGWINPYTEFSCGTAQHDDVSQPITISYNTSGYMVLNRRSWNGNAWLYSNEAVDLTAIRKISCETGNIGSGNAIYLGVSDGKNANAVAKVELSKSDGVFYLDVSNLSGNYYVILLHRNSTAGDWSWSGKEIAKIYYT